MADPTTTTAPDSNAGSEEFTQFPPIPSPESSRSPEDPKNSAANPTTTTTTTTDARPTVSADAVLKPSVPIPKTWNEVSGPDFNTHPRTSTNEITVSSLLSSMANIGFQGSNLSQAREIIDKMRLYRSPEGRKATIFLGYTSNLISSGLRSTLRYLVEHNHVSALVTSAGGVEEDFIKCLAPTYMGSFSLDGASLRSQGLNRIGNLIVPNDNYCKFEDWVVPILDAMLAEQEDPEIQKHWTPSEVIWRLGKEINHPDSVYYWAYKNQIPVFCPALTDGSLGDMLYFHTFKSSPQQLKIDIVKDIRNINLLSVRADKAGAVILGGGMVKHHISNACLMRNGAEWAVMVNTASEFDGSDAGARPDEAVSWGKIKTKEMGGEAVKVTAEVTVVFPMLVAATWASGDGQEEEQKED